MDYIENSLNYLNKIMKEESVPLYLTFEEYLNEIRKRPARSIRNIFQVFSDMIDAYLGKGVDEYSEDPESIHYLKYDCERLFVQGSDNPFFADRLFANRLVVAMESMRRGTQQNKIYIFKGPPGSGKSTFLNNLLRTFQEYANTERGRSYEAVWRINKSTFGSIPEYETASFMDKLYVAIEGGAARAPHMESKEIPVSPFTSKGDEYIEIPCPSHDHPLLILPRPYRAEFLKRLLEGDPFKEQLFNDKQYEWVFKDKACTICNSLYHSLLGRVKRTEQVHAMLHARPYLYKRRLGEGISVFNPGDAPIKQASLTNNVIQRQINSMLKSSSMVKYIYSQYAKTNNGIYALMDIKSHNKDRLIELHNIISEGIHKVEDLEESVNSILIAVMNPEDQKGIGDLQSFSDRIEYITVPYVMDLNTEIDIYRNVFGEGIKKSFLPRVLQNFGRIIISTRLNTKSKAMLEWIEKPEHYSLYCDENLQLLKMSIYAGYIPDWLTEEDRRKLTARLRRKIIGESELEGEHGISGRDSIKIFSDFISTYAKKDKLINMRTLYDFFTKTKKELSQLISTEFLDSLVRMYDYTILQEVKESLYYYNRIRISKDIQNYLFAINFEMDTTQTCNYTNERLEITEEFFQAIEDRLLGANKDIGKRSKFREQVQKEYTTDTLTREMMVENKTLTKTRIYTKLHDMYVYNLKEKALDPFLANENFRRAIKDYSEKDFNSYDKRIKRDVRFLLQNLIKKFDYTEQGAQEMCTYVIDHDLAKKFENA